jgi:hypothetical protein
MEQYGLWITNFENIKDDFHKKGMDKIVCLLDKSLYMGAIVCHSHKPNSILNLEQAMIRSLA